MDRNQFVGILILTLGLTVYLHYFGPKQKEKNVSTFTQKEGTNNNDILSQPKIKLQKDYGIFENYINKKNIIEQDIKLENEELILYLNPIGARISKVILKKYKDPKGKLLEIYNNKKGYITYEFQYIDTSTNIVSDLSIDNLIFKYKINNNEVIFFLNLDEKHTIKRSFRLNSNYMIDQNFELQGFEKNISNDNIYFIWNNKLKLLENDIKKSLEKATINYFSDSGNFNSLKIKQDKLVEEKFTNTLKWLSFKQRFFTSGIIYNQPIKTQANLSMVPLSQEQSLEYLKKGNIKLSINLNDMKNNKIESQLFFGPNKYKILKKVTKKFENNLFLGWPIVRWINKFFTTPIFDFLSKYINNVGLIIILFVIFIKILLLPLSFKSQISLSKMKVIKPELDEIKNKYKGDNRKIQMEQVALYREMGINPLGGCIPILMQMPMLIAMFNFFPNAIEIRGASFLWVKDLSTYDSILDLPFTIPIYGNHVSLFTLLMTISTIISTITNKQMSSNNDDSMKFATYLMPIMFMFILNSFPAALSLYYFTSNMLTILQQYIISKFVNEKKLRDTLEKNKANYINKTQKIPRSQARLEKFKKKDKKK